MGAKKLTIAAAMAPLASLGLGAAADQAQAQTDEYAPIGMPAGGFRFFPMLSAGVEYNDNILATATNEQSDYVYTLVPSARLESDWNTHELNLYAEAPSRFYTDNDDQNSTDVIVGGAGRLDVDRSFNFTGEAHYGSLHEPLRESPATAALAEPVEYTQTRFGAGFAKAFAQFQVSGKIGVEELDYEDGVLLGGGTLDQDDRDRTSTTAGLRLDYNISPATSWFVTAEGNQREYDLEPPDVTVNRNSDGYAFLAGVKFEATRLVTGEIGVGYMQQNYDEPGAEATDGLAVRTALVWSPDELVNVRIGAERAVRDAGAAGAISYVANDFTLGVDYAFRRNITVNGEVGYSRDEYENIDREDKRSYAQAGIEYALNRVAGVFFNVSHDEQDSTGADLGREYEVNRASIGIRLRR